MTVVSGVFPVYRNVFKIGAASGTLNTISGMTSFGVSIDNGVEEWKPFESEGWTRRLLTAKSITISLKGKRVIGDMGNDFVADMALCSGADALASFEWTLPSGTKVAMSCVVSVKNNGGGESTNVGDLEFDVLSDGKPTVTPAG